MKVLIIKTPKCFCMSSWRLKGTEHCRKIHNPCLPAYTVESEFVEAQFSWYSWVALAHKFTSPTNLHPQ